MTSHEANRALLLITVSEFARLWTKPGVGNALTVMDHQRASLAPEERELLDFLLLLLAFASPKMDAVTAAAEKVAARISLVENPTAAVKAQLAQIRIEALKNQASDDKI